MSYDKLLGDTSKYFQDSEIAEVKLVQICCSTKGEKEVQSRFWYARYTSQIENNFKIPLESFKNVPRGPKYTAYSNCKTLMCFK